jgi:uncharacterized RDD family membrane protein YckC
MMRRQEGRIMTSGSAEKWNLDPDETLLAVARVSPPGRIEAQSAGNGFELALTNRRLLVSKRRMWRNKDRTSIVDRIPLDLITAVRTEKRHPAATFGIPLFRLDLVQGSLENGFSFEASSFGVRHLEALGRALIEQRPALAAAPWPDPPTPQPSLADAADSDGANGSDELSEEQRAAMVKAKRRLYIVVGVLVVVTTGGIILWRTEDHPRGNFTPATIVLLVALQILLYAWQLWEGILRSTRRAQPVDPSAPGVMDVSCAGFWRRAAGFLIDWAVIVAIALVVEILVLTLAHPVFGADVSITHNSGVGANVLLVGVPLLFILYPIAFIGGQGQSIGMRLMKIRLYAITAGGAVARAGRGKVVGRTFISLFFFWALFAPALIDYLWALGGPHHQCLHDKWSGTIAIDVRHGPPQRSVPADGDDASTAALEAVSGD